ncbi:MAG: 3'-5' exoribonuclease YhaM family protein [Candidatus Hydrothermarchaeales archaeon]
MPALPKEKIKALFSELKGFIQGIEDTHLKGVLERFYENKEFVEVFKKAPAARKHHHNYIGGLLEHTVNVARLCDTISRFYSLDRDLLITGALLHDLGKTKEYSLKASVDVTDEGRFIGHLPLTAEMVGKEMGEINDFPQTTKLKIIHMLLSHHGELEFGSPKEPGFPEAMALFHADYMDAYVKNVLQEIEGAGEEEPWIFSRSMGRFIHTGKRPENHIKEESRKSVRENEGRHR